MRTLPALLATAALVALNTTAIAQAEPGSYWYNGDWNFVKGLPNERNTLVTQAAVYDDFYFSYGGYLPRIFLLYSRNLVTPGFVITGATWEIRAGVSEGNAGTLIASGLSSVPIFVPTGRSGFGLSEYTVEVIVPDVYLPILTRTYWVNVTPIGNGTGRSFSSTTSGAGCVGSPCGNNDNAFFNSSYFGAKFRNTNNAYGQHDFSMGVLISAH